MGGHGAGATAGHPRRGSTSQLQQLRATLVGAAKTGGGRRGGPMQRAGPPTAAWRRGAGWRLAAGLRALLASVQQRRRAAAERP